ncbi:MAG TPA: PH domain-containing protein, partial [Actinomycetota bacterium]|nr:PH domain-containing protein [Actinomycetota bacterium]
PKGNAAVGLTNRRLMFFNYSALGKPKDLVGEIPLEQIVSVEQGQKKIMHNVRFGFSDGSAVEVECAKMEKVGDFVSTFQRVKAGT